MSIYDLLFGIFDKWFWRWRYLKKWNIVKTPNLNGEWSGELRSSFDTHSSKVKVTLKISQTWTKIRILLFADQSSSHSVVANVMIDSPEGKCLIYQYENEPKSNAVETMHIHRGTTTLIFNEDENILKGEYYSGRDRQKFGSLYFSKIKDNIS
jgi:hypothetical protein